MFLEITGELLLLFDKETETPFLHSDEDRIRLLEEVAKLHISKASAGSLLSISLVSPLLILINKYHR